MNTFLRRAKIVLVLSFFPLVLIAAAVGDFATGVAANLRERGSDIRIAMTEMYAKARLNW